MQNLVPTRFVALLLCIALLVRVIVPAGFMPDMEAARQGLFKIKICTVYGAKDIFVDQSQAPVDIDKLDKTHKSEKTKASVCPFAGAMGAALLALGMGLALLFLPWLRLRFGRKHYAFLPGSPSACWPRGPPSLI